VSRGRDRCRQCGGKRPSATTGAGFGQLVPGSRDGSCPLPGVKPVNESGLVLAYDWASFARQGTVVRVFMKRAGKGTESRKRAREWRAVEIVCDHDACDASRGAAGDRYLAVEAPLLPLPDCDRRGQCKCRYRHHEDRRKGPRRGNEGAMPSQPLTDQADRRYMDGRRRVDLDAWAEYEAEVSQSLDDTYFNFVNRARFREPT